METNKPLPKIKLLSPLILVTSRAGSTFLEPYPSTTHNGVGVIEHGSIYFGTTLKSKLKMTAAALRAIWLEPEKQGATDANT